MTIEVRARDLGVTPGMTDASDALRRVSGHVTALATTGQEVRLIFEPGTYPIAQYATTHIYGTDPNTGQYAFYSGPLHLANVDYLTVDGEGAIFEHEGGYTTTHGQNNGPGWAFPYCGIVLENCTYSRIRNCTFIGGADNLTRGYVTATGQLHAELYSHGVSVLGGSYIRLDGVRVEAFISDGFCFDGHEAPGASWHELAENVLMRNCTAVRCGRNAITTAESRYVYAYDSEFSDTGRAQYGGHSPVAGLDVEPDRTPIDGAQLPIRYRSGRHLFKRCNFKNNLLRAVVSVYQRVDGTTFEDCVMESDSTQDYDIEIRAPGSITRRCTITGRRPRFGHEPSSTLGDDGRWAYVEDCDIYVNGVESAAECTIDGARLHFRRNRVTLQRGLRAASIACDTGIIEHNVFRTYNKWCASIFSNTTAVTIRNNTWLTDLGPSDFNLSNANDRCWVFRQSGAAVTTGNTIGPFVDIEGQ